MPGNFSGGSFSGGVGGFSVDITAETLVGLGHGTGRKKLKKPRKYSDPDPEVVLPLHAFTPLEQAAYDLAVDEDAQDDELLIRVLALMVLH